MKQLTLLDSKQKNIRKTHGGDPSISRRRTRRPLSTKYALHVTLRSDLATGGRCLLRHQTLIQALLRKTAKRFRITVYEKAICGNHLHLLIRGHQRIDIQNFFRVFAGHCAQQILKLFPVTPQAAAHAARVGGAPKNTCKHQKNQRKFWRALVFSRLLSSWGREYRTVKNYVIQNTLEALKVIAYQPRKPRTSKKTFTKSTAVKNKQSREGHNTS